MVGVSGARRTAARPLLEVPATGAESRPDLRFPGSRVPAARLSAVAAGWAKRINPLLRHAVEGVHRLGSLGYQTGLFGASADDQRTGYVHDPVPTDTKSQQNVTG